MRGRPTDTGPAGPVQHLGELLGPDSLAGLLEASRHGITVRRATGEYLYANAETLRLLETPDLESALAAHPELARSPVPARIDLRLTDGTARTIECSDHRTTAPDHREVIVTVLRDLEESIGHDRRLASFARAAGSIAYAGSIRDTLSAVAREVWQTADLAATQILLIDPVTKRTGVTGAAGTTHLPDDFDLRHDQVHRNGGEMMSILAVAEGRPLVRRDRRRAMLADPTWAPMHDWFASFEWSDFVAVPLIVRGVPVGAMNAYCRPGHHPTERDLTFFTAICDQAAVAVENARLFAESRRRSELEERNRIARGLHDAISQKLFSITLHAKAIALAIRRDPAGALPISDSVGALTELAQSALQDMRDVIGDLHPATLSRVGLVAAIEGSVSALAQRTRASIDVSAPLERLPIEPRAEENIYRLVTEALHNAVKHSGATHVHIRLAQDTTQQQGSLLVEITDDGQGFDPSAALAAGHFGLLTMRERADAIGGSLEIVSGVGHGTTVRFRAPVIRPTESV